MRRLLVAAVALVLTVYAGCRIRFALASDETKIRWLIEDTAEGFNETSLRRTLAGIADDWHDRTTAMHKDTLEQLLRYSFFQDRVEKTREYRHHVVVSPETVVVQVDGDRASFSCSARFSELKQGEFMQVRVVAFDGELRKDEDGWKVTSTGHRSLEGPDLGP